MANNMAEPMPVLPSTGHLLKMPIRDGLDSIVANVGPGGDWPGDNAGSGELLSPVSEKEAPTIPITNNVEKLPVPLPNVPATQLNCNNKQEVRHLPIPLAPQAPVPVNKRHVPVPQLPQRPPPITLPAKAAFLQQVTQAQSPPLPGGTTPVPANKRHLQVQQSPQVPPVPINRTPAYMNRQVSTNATNSTSNAQTTTAAKKTWPSAVSSNDPGTFNQRQWRVQYHHVPMPVNKRHLPVQEAPKGPTNHTFKQRERENRNNLPFGLKEPPPMHSTANKLKTNRNMDRAGIEEALLGQERRPMLKNKQANPYQFVLQDHNYGAPPPLSPPRSPVTAGPPTTIDADRSAWAPGQLYRPRIDDDATSAISSERGREVEPEGEETETAPEGEGDEDAITRCICDFQHDDGYMVRCDKCFVWQHLDCMGLDRNNPPKPDDEYLCERCQPRPVERHKARTLQMRKREEIANDSSSDSSSSAFTDDNIRHANRSNMPGALPKKRAQTLAGGRRKSEPTNPRKPSTNVPAAAKQQQQQQHRQRQQAAQAANNIKEQHAVQRRASTPGGKKNNPPQREKRAVVRRKSKATSRASDDETSQEDWNRPSEKLRTWIDNYEEAVTNHYSPELRAKVSSIKVNGVHSGVLGLHNVPNLVGKCTVRMIEPGIRVLQSATNIPSNQPVIELRGKHMLATQHKPNPTLPVANKKTRPYVPFVFFYRLPKDKDDTEVCVDSRTYGNDARFVRRSCKPNSEVWHCMEKGMLHLYIVSTCAIDKNTEITIAHDKHADPPAHCVCSNPKDCGIHPRNNGPQLLVPETKVEEVKERRKRRGRRTRSTSVGDRQVRPSREKPKERPSLRAAAKEKEPPVVVKPPPVVEPPASTKVRRTLSRERRLLRTTTTKEVPVVKEPTPPVAAPIVATPKAPKVVKEKEKPVTPTPPPPPPPPPRVPTPRPVTPVEVVAPPTRRSSNPRTPVKVDPVADQEDRKGEDSEEKKAEDSKTKVRAILVPLPTRRSSNPRTPVKVDAAADQEDRKGEDSEEKKAEDSKTKTREDRKIEAIMKAFERMERESKRKVDNQSKQAKRKDTPRKDSSEIKREQEPVIQPPPTPVFNERQKKRRRKGRGRTNSTTTPSAPKRRRTRFNSGRSDSDSTNDGDTTGDSKMGPPFTSPSVSSAAGLLMALSQPNNGHCYPADKLQTPSPPPGGVPSQFDSGCSSSSSHSSVTPTLSPACLLVAAAVGPLAPGFKFPKTKKGLMNEWLNKSPEFPPTPSPTLTHPYPPIGTEEGFPFNKSLDTLAQAAIATSPNKENHGSAKKRWLRQVMSQEGDGSGSPNSRAGSPPCTDYVTPLKKRRVARESQSSEQSFTPPTTPTEQGSPKAKKTAEDDDPTTSPDEQNEDDDEDLTRKSPNTEKRNESSRSILPSDASPGDTDRRSGSKSPSSDSEPRGTCEIVSVPNTPSLSRADSPQGADSEISAAQLVQMQSDIRKQLARGDRTDEDRAEEFAAVSVKVEKKETVSGESTLSESKPEWAHNSDCLQADSKLAVRTVLDAVNEKFKSEDDTVKTDVIASVNCKVSTSVNAALDLDSKMEMMFKTDRDQECAMKVNEAALKVEQQAKEEAKIAKRKLSISEYRQRKQLDPPTGPSEPTSLNISPSPRVRSNSSSSSTGSSSSLSDEEPPKPVLPLLPDLPAFLPPYADPIDDKKGVVSDPLVDIDEKRRGLPPPPSPLPSRGTFPFQNKPSTNYSSAPYTLNNSINYITTITGNRPNSTSYPSSNRCPTTLPNRFSNLPYSMTGNFQSTPPVIPREVQPAGGPQNAQTSSFAMSRGNKAFHTVAAAKAYFPHRNLHDRE